MPEAVGFSNVGVADILRAEELSRTSRRSEVGGVGQTFQQQKGQLPRVDTIMATN